MKKRIEVEKGEKYGRYTIIKEVEKRNGKRYILCECTCGTLKEVNLYSLRNGSTKSCGCLLRETKKHLKTHGQWNKPIYGVWRGMIQRCTNPNNFQFKNYGGRGIKVCDNWMTAKNFIDWAFDNGYEHGLSIDRIDVNGNYEPDNCRWITMRMQHSNKRSNIIIEYKGVKKTLRQWSNITGTNHETLRRRLKEGWGTERALFGKNQQGKKYRA